MPRSYSSEFRRRVIELCRMGGSRTEIARDLVIPKATAHRWIAQEEIDLGQRWCRCRGSSATPALRGRSRSIVANRYHRAPHTGGQALLLRCPQCILPQRGGLVDRQPVHFLGVQRARQGRRARALSGPYCTTSLFRRYFEGSS